MPITFTNYAGYVEAYRAADDAFRNQHQVEDADYAANRQVFLAPYRNDKNAWYAGIVARLIGLLPAENNFQFEVSLPNGGGMFPNNPDIYVFPNYDPKAVRSGRTGVYLLLKRSENDNGQFLVRFAFGEKIEGEANIQNATQIIGWFNGQLAGLPEATPFDGTGAGPFNNQLPQVVLGTYAEVAKWFDDPHLEMHVIQNRLGQFVQTFERLFGTPVQVALLQQIYPKLQPWAIKPQPRAILVNDGDRPVGRGNALGNPYLPMKSPNVILYGPPGTGKTYATVSIAAQLLLPESASKSWSDLLENDKVEREERQKQFSDELGRRIHLITFHQSYSYEDFIGGLRPVIPKKATASPDATLIASEKSGGGNLQFDWTSGIFLRACAAAYKVAKKGDEAAKEGDAVEEFLNFCGEAGLDSFNKLAYKDLAVVLVIDEINRANMSRVFGELITLLEEDKRLGGKEQLLVQLPNRSDCKFGVPKNLIIIGTMNTADKSLALLDLALRRRFEFHRLDPKPDPNVANLRLRTFLTKLNTAIAKERKSLDYGIGHAYFMRSDITADLTEPQIQNVLTDILQRKIVPLLQEYFGGDDTKVIKILAGAGVDLVTEPKDEKNERKQWIKVPVEFVWKPEKPQAQENQPNVEA